MNSNPKKSGLGKYAGVHGVVFKNDVMPAAPAKGVIGKAGGKTCNMPMDSDAEFEKRVKRYDRQRQAAAEAAEKARLSAVKNETEVEAVPARYDTVLEGSVQKPYPIFHRLFFISGLFLRIYSGRYNRRCFSNED